MTLLTATLSLGAVENRMLFEFKPGAAISPEPEVAGNAIRIGGRQRYKLMVPPCALGGDHSFTIEMRVNPGDDVYSSLFMAEWNADALRSGQAEYRAAIRAAVRRTARSGEAIIRMSWEPWTPEHIQDGIEVVRRIGANEIGIHGGWEFEPTSLTAWKQAGYRTFMLANPLAKRHIEPELAQKGWGESTAVRATGNSARIELKPLRAGKILADSIIVRDLTAGMDVPALDWQYHDVRREIVVTPAVENHSYRVFYLNADVWHYDPFNPRARKECLDRFVAENKRYTGYLDAAWIQGLGLAWLGQMPQGWDWNSFTFGAGPASQRQFTVDTGVAFDPAWLTAWQTTGNLFINAVVADEYFAWMEWTQGRMRIWLREVYARCRGDLKMAAWQYWGDAHVGMEPCLGTVLDTGAQQLDTALRNCPVEARCLVDVPGPISKLFRVDWHTFRKTETMPVTDPQLRSWSVSKRGLLAELPVGIYWTPFYYVTHGVDAFTADFYMERVAEVNDEFRLLVENIGGRRCFTHPLNVVVLTAWGKAFSWHPWGSTVLSHLTALPVNVTFHSFREVADGGIPEGTDVLFLFGLPNTSWSGGRFWEKPELGKAVETFVAGGGGLMAFQAASFAPHSGQMALSHILGVSMQQDAA